MIIAPTRRSYDLKSVQPFDWHEQNIYTVFNTVALVNTQYKCALYGQVLFEWLKTKKCQRSTVVRLFFLCCWRYCCRLFHLCVCVYVLYSVSLLIRGLIRVFFSFCFQLPFCCCRLINWQTKRSNTVISRRKILIWKKKYQRQSEREKNLTWYEQTLSIISTISTEKSAVLRLILFFRLWCVGEQKNCAIFALDSIVTIQTYTIHLVTIHRVWFDDELTSFRIYIHSCWIEKTKRKTTTTQRTCNITIK